MTFVDTWDSGQPGANWDSGLQWDVNVGPNPGTVAAWADLITSQYNQQPLFMQTLRNVLQPLADGLAVVLSFPALYDLDTAVGEQLDAVGVWIGVSRILNTPLPNTFFTWDEAGLGWDEGTWWSPANPVNSTLVLADDAYRTLLRARAANNQWDGTIPGAYDIWDILFAGTGYTIDIVDNQDMTMEFILRGPTPDAVTMALLDGGYLSLKPAGVSATYGYQP